MTLQQKKSKAFGEAIERYEWFKKELDQYVADGDFTRKQADAMLEDMADQLDL